ncbi:MAG: extracellular solute-binding protein [Oscillospiraceae bacterium]|nr:extracellular solute-binding protein [Oscillospiraceae bacterium]
MTGGFGGEGHGSGLPAGRRTAKAEVRARPLRALPYALPLALLIAFAALASCSAGGADDADVGSAHRTDGGAPTTDPQGLGTDPGQAGGATDGDRSGAGTESGPSEGADPRGAILVVGVHFDADGYGSGWDSLNEWSEHGLERYREMYGFEVEFRPLGRTGPYVSQVEAMHKAGIAPDVILFWSQCVPRWVHAGILEPLSEHIDLSGGVWADGAATSRPAMRDASWGGVPYGVYWPTFPYMVFYDREMVLEAGLADPYALYKEGGWDWDAFFSIGKALTRDLTGNRINDVWGYLSWWVGRGFAASNGVEYVGADEWGEPFFALDHRYVEAMKAMDAAIYTHRMVDPVWWDPSPLARFLDGGAAMVYWDGAFCEALKAVKGESLGLAPHPRGPSLDAGLGSRDMYGSAAIGICSGSLVKGAAADFIRHTFAGSEPEAAGERERRRLELIGDPALYADVMQWGSEAVSMSYQGFGEAFARAVDLLGAKPKGVVWEDHFKDASGACEEALAAYLAGVGHVRGGSD